MKLRINSKHLIFTFLLNLLMLDSFCQTTVIAFEQGNSKLIEINLASESSTSLVNISQSTFWNASCFDELSNKYSISSNGNLFTLQMPIGDLLTSIPIDNNYVGFQYSTQLNRIIAYYQGSGSIVSIRTEDGNIENITQLPNNIYWNASTLISELNHYIVSGNGNIYIIDLNNNSIINSFAISNNLVGFHQGNNVNTFYSYEQGTGNIIEVNLISETSNIIGNIASATYWNSSTFIKHLNQYILSSNGQLFVFSTSSGNLINSFPIDNNLVGFESLSASTTTYEIPNSNTILYPNPTSNDIYLKIDNPNSVEEILIINTLGKEYRPNYKIEPNRILIATECIENGIYNCIVRTKYSTYETCRFIVEKNKHWH